MHSQPSAIWRLPLDFCSNGSASCYRGHPHHLYLLLNGARVANGLDDVAGARLALSAEHRCPFRDTPLHVKEGGATKHKKRRNEIRKKP